MITLQPRRSVVWQRYSWTYLLFVVVAYLAFRATSLAVEVFVGAFFAIGVLALVIFNHSRALRQLPTAIVVDDHGITVKRSDAPTLSFRWDEVQNPPRLPGSLWRSSLYFLIPTLRPLFEREDRTPRVSSTGIVLWRGWERLAVGRSGLSGEEWARLADEVSLRLREHHVL